MLEPGRIVAAHLDDDAVLLQLDDAPRAGDHAVVLRVLDERGDGDVRDAAVDDQPVPVLVARDRCPHVARALEQAAYFGAVADQRVLRIAVEPEVAGHRVVGADFHRLSPGRVSAAIDVFHRLPWPRKTPLAEDEDIEDDPYALALLEIVKEEGVDLWVSVSDVNTAIQDALAAGMVESQTSAKACQLNAKYVRILHEKDLFMQEFSLISLPHSLT